MMTGGNKFGPPALIVVSVDHPTITVAPSPGVVVIDQTTRAPAIDEFCRATIEIGPVLCAKAAELPIKNRPRRDWEQRRASKHRRPK